MSAQSVEVRICDFIQMHPGTIVSIHSDPNNHRLHVSRPHYSQIYHADTSQNILTHQLVEMEPCMHMLDVEGCLMLFQQFQLKICIDGRWNYHPFTTQLLSLRQQGKSIYTFHQRESMVWRIQDARLDYQYLNPSRTPYHLDHEHTLNGYGKKVKSIGRHQLTVCDVIDRQWIFVGDESGRLHVLESKFCTPVKTFNEHAAAILAIKADAETKTVYFSGSDSRIGMIRLVGNQWKLGTSIRGQSHDLLALELMGNYLISGGVSTDLCFYPLEKGEFKGEFTHRVSYCGVNRVVSQLSYIVANHRNRFQVWKVGPNEVRTELMVDYQMPQGKFIVDTKLFRQPLDEGSFLLLIFTDQDTVGWKLSSEEGLTKYMTIQNQYILAQTTNNHGFIGVRNDGFIERVSCLTGKIEQACQCEVELPTHLKIMGKAMVLVASSLSHTASIVSLKRKETIKKLKLPFSTPFDYLDIMDSSILIHHVNHSSLLAIDPDNSKACEVASLPVGVIRFGGWLGTVSKDKHPVKAPKKKYWWAASEGKLLIVPNLGRKGQRKVRVKQTHRIAQVVRPSGKYIGCDLAVIPHNFETMVEELPIQPVFTKKIQ